MRTCARCGDLDINHIGTGMRCRDMNGNFSAEPRDVTAPKPAFCDKPQQGGELMVGVDPWNREVVINLDQDRTGHITFSPEQARNLARLLTDKANWLDAMP